MLRRADEIDRLIARFDDFLSPRGTTKFRDEIRKYDSLPFCRRVQLKKCTRVTFFESFYFQNRVAGVLLSRLLEGRLKISRSNSVSFETIRICIRFTARTPRDRLKIFNTPTTSSKDHLEVDRG